MRRGRHIGVGAAAAEALSAIDLGGGRRYTRIRRALPRWLFPPGFPSSSVSPGDEARAVAFGSPPPTRTPNFRPPAVRRPRRARAPGRLRTPGFADETPPSRPLRLSTPTPTRRRSAPRDGIAAARLGFANAAATRFVFVARGSPGAAMDLFATPVSLPDAAAAVGIGYLAALLLKAVFGVAFVRAGGDTWGSDGGAGDWASLAGRMVRGGEAAVGRLGAAVAAHAG